MTNEKLTTAFASNKFLTVYNRAEFGDFVRALEAGQKLVVYLVLRDEEADSIILDPASKGEELTEARISKLWRVVNYWVDGRDGGELLLTSDHVTVTDGEAMKTLKGGKPAFGH